ncbi:hypothetical protein [Erwinia persicina]|uniref:Uncharacterized protein n=1 Tax=Erwinia persicina TaxID=55211 RepID=A0ABR8ZX71_9GAMM|nr:hypothetical protein [Erwinia persicina]MBD8108301.1 hypothetical protein [Erwinia persicina]MBD8211292.1 hypothetical protein [Erwinia persicina]
MCIKKIENEQKNNKQNFMQKNKRIIFILSLIVIIILCEQGLEFILKKGSQSIDLKTIREIYKNNILLGISFIGGIAISALYLTIGKCIKAANDFFLFFPAAIVLYQSYTLPEGDFISNLYKIISIETLAIFKSLILLCSFAKFLISLCEFKNELFISLKTKSSTKETLIKELMLEINILTVLRNKHNPNDH